MSKKQTSIEWLIEQLPIRVVNSLQEEIAKAKAMHKEEINKAAYDGYYTEGMCDIREYYNETYGQQ